MIKRNGVPKKIISNKELSTLFGLIAIFGTILLTMIVVVCCYCCREKKINDRAKLYYQQNLQSEGGKIIRAQN